jgi:hypothetical protein
VRLVCCSPLFALVCETKIGDHMKGPLRWVLLGFFLGPLLGFGQDSGSTGKRPEAHVPFPEIRDWNSLRITLSRSACRGTCPIYEIAIHGDGTVLYDGRAYVRTKGKKELQISHTSLVQLVDTFRKVDYFSLADRYVAGVTDNPTYVTSISFDGVSKSVVDYVGRKAGMPPGVSDVEAAIDRLSGVSKWVGGK